MAGKSATLEQGSDLHAAEATSFDGAKLIPNEYLCGYCDLVRDLGGDAGALLAAGGIDGSSLQQRGGKIPLLATAMLLENSARALDCADFGLQLAERQNGALMKPLDRLICNAPTLGDIDRYIVSHMEAYSSGIRATLERDAERRMYFFSFQLLLDDFVSCPQIAEQINLLAHNSSMALTGGVARAREVWFSHPRAGCAINYARRFGAPVKFGQPFDGVFYTDADFESKVVGRDPGVFASEYRAITERFPAHLPGLEVRVRQAIVRALAEEDCTREQVAASLGVHSRTLQRRLCRIGTSFESLRDEVRRSLAARYLARSDLRLAEIVHRLGYSEPAVFSRSCRRWFAATPSELRRHLTR